MVPRQVQKLEIGVGMVVKDRVKQVDCHLAVVKTKVFEHGVLLEHLDDAPSHNWCKLVLAEVERE